MAKQIKIGSYEFKSGAAAKRFIRSVRDAYPTDGLEIIGFDALFLYELLALHPDASEKIGSGISYFTVGTEQVFKKTRHFIIHRTDGTATDFSFNTCVDGKNERSDKLESLRRAIADQVVCFRNHAFANSTQLVCPIDGSYLTPNMCHVDHEHPHTFLTIVERWLSSKQLTLELIQITSSADNQIVSHMTDNDQLASWRAFHASNSKLRIISQRSNLSTVKNTTT